MATCERCDESISKDADQCKHCGYNPAEELQEKATKQLAGGIACMIFIITIPLTPFCIYSWWTYKRKAKRASPVASTSPA